MNDRQLIRRIQKGQKELLNVIARKYYDDIYYFCLYMTGQREDSYDLTQETFLKFIGAVDRYQYQNLKGYLLTIARNSCMDYFRREQKKPVATNPQSEEPGEMSPLEREMQKETYSGRAQMACPQTTSIEKWMDRQMLLEELQKLPQMQREALVLYYYQEMKTREIAAFVGVSDSTVKSRIRQGTMKLKKIMREDGYEG